MSSWCKDHQYFSRCIQLAHHSLLKLKKYKGLVYNEDEKIAEIDKITDSTSNMKVNN